MPISILPKIAPGRSHKSRLKLKDRKKRRNPRLHAVFVYPKIKISIDEKKRKQKRGKNFLIKNRSIMIKFAEIQIAKRK